jgi:hypothetical protein
MASTRPILIACPQYHTLVRGQYACDAAGCYLLGPGGSFLLERASCDQRGGRCSQSLCVLHRYNRQGSGSWFPEKIIPAPARPATRRRGKPGAGASSNWDLLA